MINKRLDLRKFEKSDIEEVYKLLNDLSNESKKFFHPHDFSREKLKEIYSSGKDHYFVMTCDKKIIGYSFLRLFGYEIPSYGGCIDQDYHGKGFGTLLTKSTIEKAQKLGYKKVILKVYKSNTRAFNVYKKLGFKIVELLEDTDELKMERSLK